MLEGLRSFGHDRHQFTWGERTFTIRSLSVEDDVYVFDKAGVGLRSDMARLWRLRLYFTVMSIVEIDGINIYEACFGKQSASLTDQMRDTICATLVPIFSQWNSRPFRWFFKYIWAWTETHGLKYVKEMNFQEFMTPSEATIYAEMKALEQIEGVGADLARDSELENLSDALNTDDVGDSGS